MKWKVKFQMLKNKYLYFRCPHRDGMKLIIQFLGIYERGINSDFNQY